MEIIETKRVVVIKPLWRNHSDNSRNIIKKSSKRMSIIFDNITVIQTEEAIKHDVVFVKVWINLH